MEIINTNALYPTSEAGALPLLPVIMVSLLLIVGDFLQMHRNPPGPYQFINLQHTTQYDVRPQQPLRLLDEAWK